MFINSNGLDELIWRTCSPCNGLLHNRSCYKIFYKLGKNWRMEESKDKCVVKKF
jgi:hypothetical protein